MTTTALNDLIGKPYEYGARGPDAFDCWGLVLVVRARMGLPVPPDWASRAMAPAEARRLMWATAADQVDEVVARLGAVAFDERSAHAGVFVRGRVVHSVYRVGVVAWTLGHWLAVFPDSRFYEWHTSSSC